MAKKNRPPFESLEEELRFLSEIGADFIMPLEKSGKAPRRSVQPDAGRAARAVPESPIQPSASKESPERLEDVNDRILACTRCPLSQGRTQAVPGEGHVRAELMFVGEGPGADEDIQGRPFVGRAGQLLTKIIAAMGFKREDVYITNVVKCRPPKNRQPERGEIEACRPYLVAQIEAISPRVIVTLGKVAADFFQPSAVGMTKRRGHFIEYEKRLVMPTFHPSYLVRNEGNRELKRAVWQDMQQVMAALGKK